MASCLGLQAAKKQQPKTVGVMFFSWNALIFVPDVLGCKSCLVLPVQRTFGFVFFLVSGGFHMNTNFNGCKWGLQLFKCCFGFFRDLLIESSMCYKVTNLRNGFVILTRQMLLALLLSSFFRSWHDLHMKSFSKCTVHHCVTQLYDTYTAASFAWPQTKNLQPAPL